MTLNSLFGNNADLKTLCGALGVSEDICKQIEKLDGDLVKKSAAFPCEWSEYGMGFSLLVGLKTNNGEVLNILDVDYYGEGPHTDLVIEYIKRAIEEELATEYYANLDK